MECLGCSTLNDDVIARYIEMQDELPTENDEKFRVAEM